MWHLERTHEWNFHSFNEHFNEMISCWFGNLQPKWQPTYIRAPTWVLLISGDCAVPKYKNLSNTRLYWNAQNFENSKTSENHSVGNTSRLVTTLTSSERDVLWCLEDRICLFIVCELFSPQYFTMPFWTSGFPLFVVSSFPLPDDWQGCHVRTEVV